MTREEAKKIFFELLLFRKAPCKKEELEDLCKIVLTALEQEPVLDKIKGQIEDYLHGVEITLEVLAQNDPLRPKMEGAKDTLEECLELIDKAETEE